MHYQNSDKDLLIIINRIRINNKIRKYVKVRMYRQYHKKNQGKKNIKKI